MTKRICSVDDCDGKVVARDWCAKHYGAEYRSGRIAKGDRMKHALSNVDPSTMTADCAACGTGAKIRPHLRADGSTRYECRCPRGERKKYPARKAPQRRRDWLREKYGMTTEEFQIRFEAQQGRCLICQLPHEKLAVDHCHKSGEIRGLLCRGCNLALGLMLDNPKAFERAAQYLRRYAA